MPKTIRLLFFTFLISGFIIPANAQSGPANPDPGLSLGPGQIFAFANGRSAFWVGEARRENLSRNQGFFFRGRRLLKDYRFQQDSLMVNRPDARRVLRYPGHLTREYGDMTESLYLLDSLPVMVIHLTSQHPINVRFLPQVDPILGTLDWQSDSLHSANIARIADGSWLGIAAFGEQDRLLFDNQAFVLARQRKDSKRDRDMRRKRVEEQKDVVLQKFNGLSAEGLRSTYFIFTIADTEQQLRDLVSKISADLPALLAAREKRMQKLAARNPFASNSADVNQAVALSRQSLLDLWQGMDETPLLWSGLPGNPRQGSREALLCVEGLLAAGQYEVAGSLLRNFAAAQNIDPASNRYGTFPRWLPAGRQVFEEAVDAGSWFTRACGLYLAYTGDRAFLEEIFPVVKRSVDGNISYRIDEYGFLTHGDADNWMNAVGNRRFFASRSNRALEVQVLWKEELRQAIAWAREMGFGQWADGWQLIYDRLGHNFGRFMVHPYAGEFVDHLNPDNREDDQLRPMGAFPLVMLEPGTFSDDFQQKYLSRILPELVYPWGISTLGQSDRDFHPYAFYQPYYGPGEARYNGNIANWLLPIWCQVLLPIRPDLTNQLLDRATQTILQGELPGGFPQFTDAWPRPGEDEIRAAGNYLDGPSQAGYLALWYRQVAGLQPDVLNNRLVLAPHFLPDLTALEGRLRFGNGDISWEMSHDGQGVRMVLRGNTLPLLVCAIPYRGQILSFEVPAGHKEARIEVSGEPGKATVRVNGRSVKPMAGEIPAMPALRLAQPDKSLDVPSLSKPAYTVISQEDVSQQPGRLTRLLFDIKDQSEDDNGPDEQYQYPLNPLFKKGIFDARRVRIWRTGEHFIFDIEMAELSDPGWGAEAGFQLSYLAVTLSFEKLKALRRTKVGANANFSVPLEYGFNFVIYVGNGLRLMDARGNVLAEYRPDGEGEPLGSLEEKRIRFSIPISLLSDNPLRNAAILVGGQDDRGSGGIGEFREVFPVVSDWYGGGGEKPSGNPSVYDVVWVRR
ncbi:MAG: hypothetical protein KDI06_18685 [Calditrichaeota bacterium]|nr:hypothetical protein [Calditrichota bacterium]